MATILAYIEPVPGRVYPVIPTLQELQRRGHRVTVRTGRKEVALLRSLGIDAEELAPEIVELVPTDWQARTRFGALIVALGLFGKRARVQLTDLQHAIATEHPDALLIDETSWGAAAAAEHSGLPWAFCAFSPVLVPSRDAPPFGLGLPPRRDAVGRLRDRLLGPVSSGALARVIASHVNPLRRELGLRPLHSLNDFYLAGSMFLAYTGEPFEYPRSDWPAKVRLVGPGIWDPPGEAPPWLADMQQPLVLVTCSTMFQNDRRIPEVACEAFAGEPFDVVVTTADVDPRGLTPPANVRIERSLPHGPLLRRAICTVCHAGMGITQKSLAYGVPVVAVPFGRDQPEVARRVEVAGAGVFLPARKLRPDTLRRAVHDAIAMRPGAQRLAAAFASAGGAAVAANAVEELVVARTPLMSAPAVREPALVGG